ncbi:hypothetical protein [Veronia nyctiphanis]|nr:hypothetical protein [Veronia nyctiphanis]
MNRATVARTAARPAARAPRSWTSQPVQKSPNAYAPVRHAPVKS